MTTIYDHTTIHSQTIECDVCIIGSGAGGSTLAAQLTAKGIDVVMLESGPNRQRKHFNMDEGKAFETLYQEKGSRATADLGIVIMQGKNGLH